MQNLDASPRISSAPLAADAAPTERAAFLQRTYGHLFGAIFAFALLEILWFSTPVAGWMFGLLSLGRLAWIVFMGAFVGVSALADSWARSSVSRGRQYLGLGLYTVAESLLFIPLIGLALMASAGDDGDPSLLPRACLITLTLFGGMTGVVFLSGKDFSFLRSALMFGAIASFGLVVIGAVFGFSLGLGFSYAMIALACGYILYDTSKILRSYHTDQHVAASLALFSAVMLLFWYVLRVVLSRRR